MNLIHRVLSVAQGSFATLLERLAPLLHLDVNLRRLRLQSVVLVLAEDNLGFGHGANWIHIVGDLFSGAAGCVRIRCVETVLFAEQFVVNPIVVTLLHVISLSRAYRLSVLLADRAKSSLLDREFGVLVAHGRFDSQHGVRPLLHREERNARLLNSKLSLHDSLGELLLICWGLTPRVERSGPLKAIHE